VVDHDRQVLVSSAITDLVDPDATQSLEGVVGATGIVDHPGDDRPDGQPRHSQQLTDGGLRGVSHQPGHLVVEVPGVRGVSVQVIPQLRGLAFK